MLQCPWPWLNKMKEASEHKNTRLPSPLPHATETWILGVLKKFLSAPPCIKFLVNHYLKITSKWCFCEKTFEIYFRTRYFFKWATGQNKSLITTHPLPPRPKTASSTSETNRITIFCFTVCPKWMMFEPTFIGLFCLFRPKTQLPAFIHNYLKTPFAIH